MARGFFMGKEEYMDYLVRAGIVDNLDEAEKRWKKATGHIEKETKDMAENIKKANQKITKDISVTTNKMVDGFKKSSKKVTNHVEYMEKEVGKGFKKIKQDITRNIEVSGGNLQKGLTRSQKEMSDFLRYCKHWAMRLGVFMTVGLAIRGIQRFTTEIIAAARQIDQLSKISGFSTTSLAGLDFAAKKYLISTEQLQRSLAYMNKSVASFGENIKDQVWAFGQLNIKYEELKKLKPEEQLLLIAERFKNLTDTNIKAKIAIALFQRTGREFIPILNEGADGLKRFQEQMEKVGAVMDEDFVKAAVKAGENIEIFKKQIEGLGIAFSQYFLPILTRFLEALQGGYGIEVSVKHARALAEIDFLKAKKDIELWERGIRSGSVSLEELILAEERASYNLEFFNTLLEKGEEKAEEYAEKIDGINKELEELYNQWDKMDRGIINTIQGMATAETEVDRFIKTIKELKLYGDQVDFLLRALGISVEDFIPGPDQQEEFREYNKKLKEMLEYLREIGALPIIPEKTKKGKKEKLPKKKKADVGFLDYDVFEQYNEMLKNLSATQKEVVTSMNKSFSWFFRESIKGAESWKDLLIGLFESIKNAFIDMIVQMAMKAMMLKMFSTMMSGGAGAMIPVGIGASAFHYSTSGSGAAVNMPYKEGGIVGRYAGEKQDLPKFDTGGWMTKGPSGGFPAWLHPEEAVIPFDRIPGMFAGIAKAVFSGQQPSQAITNSYTPNMTINIYSPDLTDDVQLLNVARKIGDKLEQDMRRRVN